MVRYKPNLMRDESRHVTNSNPYGSSITKEIPGRRRRTILVSVLESLRLHVDHFTLSGVLQAVTTSTAQRPGLCGRLLNTTGLAPPGARCKPRIRFLTPIWSSIPFC
jgi:hypothetical protein